MMRNNIERVIIITTTVISEQSGLASCADMFRFSLSRAFADTISNISAVYLLLY